METAPDPTSDVGVAGAQAYILEKVPEWVNKYGEKAAYFCTNDAHTEPLLKQLLEYGGYFIEADLPSPLMGYPGALGIDLTAEAGDFQKILAKVEAAICEKGGAGRFGTWAYSYGYVTSAGLAQHAMNVIKGESELADIDDIAKAYHQFSPRRLLERLQLHQRHHRRQGRQHLPCLSGYLHHGRSGLVHARHRG